MSVRSFERFEDDALNLIIIGGVVLGGILVYETLYQGYKIEKKIEGTVKAVVDEGEKIAYQAKNDAETAYSRISGQFYNLKTIEQNEEDRSAKSVAWEAYKTTLGFLMAPGAEFVHLAKETITGEITWPGYVIRSAEAAPGALVNKVEESVIYRMATGGEMTEEEIEATYPYSPDLFSNPQYISYAPLSGRKGISESTGYLPPLLK